MKKKLQRTISLIISLLIIFSSVNIMITASAASFPTGYPNTHKNTGNQLDDILKVAYTQVGYTEGSGDYTKYNDWMTKQTGYNYQGVAWCATFVCWCANQANIPTSIISRNAGTTALFNAFSSSQKHFYDSGYTPKKGDLCFFAYSYTKNSSNFAHVGIVYDVTSTGIKIIEGNCSNKVQLLTRPYFGPTYSQYIVAYATPKYANNTVVEVSSVELSKTSLSLTAGETATLTATVKPTNATNKKITWSSSDTSVATVDSNGKVTALKAGTATIKAQSSNVCYDTCELTVKRSGKLSSISIESQPTKSVYFRWETFNPEGLKIVAKYTDGTTEDVTDKCALMGTGTSIVGTRTITAKYQEGTTTQTAQFNIMVKPKLKTLTITSLPTKTDYGIGESFDASGIQVIAGFSDDTTKAVTALCQFSNFSSDKAGEKTVKVTYTQDDITVYTTFKVNVIAKVKTLKSISVKNVPTKTNYFQYEKFSSDGLKITANYSDSTTKDVTSLCTLTGNGTSKIGTGTVTVRYEENGIVQKTTFNFNVKPKFKYISLTSQPTDKEYNLGESLDLAGLRITAKYSDSSTKDVTSLCTFSGFDSDKVGEKVVTAKYTEDGVTGSTSFKANVVDKSISVEKIGVSIKPIKRVYVLGEKFDSTGLKITAYYSDSTKKTITSSCTLSGFDSSKVTSENIITVKYKVGDKTFTTSFSVEIKEATPLKTLESIYISSIPDKTTYIAGEHFDKTGLTVVAKFSDSTTSVVTSSCNTSGYNTSVVGTNTVTVSYTYLSTTKSTTLDVEITPKLTGILIEKKPDKLLYDYSEEFSSDGMVIIAKLSDGSRVDFTDKCYVTGYDANVSGKQILSVVCKYGTVTAEKTFSVIVKENKEAVKIEAVSYPRYLKTGESIEEKDLQVVLTYRDNTTKDVTNDVVIEFNNNSLGIEEATIKYVTSDSKVLEFSFFVFVGFSIA